jgi:lipopolysaccharide transport system permease protein
MKPTDLTTRDTIDPAPVRTSPGLLERLAAPFVSLWERRVLFRRVLRRDVEASFRGSVLGVLWIVLIPLAMVAVYSFVFGVVLNSTWSTEGATTGDVPLIYFCGVIIFGFFFDIVNRSPNHIRAHSTYVKKVIFPLDLLDWVLVGSAMTRLMIGLALLIVATAVLQQRIPFELPLVLLLLAPFALLMIGVAWILSAVGTYIRDLAPLITAVSPVVMFVSPVFYPLERVPEAFRGLYLLNPLTFPLENSRQVLFFGESIPWLGYGMYWLAAIAVFYAGYFFFERARPGFADVV